MKQNADRLEILILGSSYSYMGIDPRYFSKPAFNLANGAQTLKYDLFLLNKYVKSSSRLKYVILPISYITFFRELEKNKEWPRIIYYHIYMGCNYYPYSIKYNFEVSNIKSALRKLSAYYLNNEILEPWTSFGMIMTSPLSKRTRNWDNDGIIMAKAHTKFNYTDLVKTNEEYLEEIAKICKRKNIKLVLVTTPVWYTYRENLDIKQLKIMRNSTLKITKKYDNVHYFDFLLDDRFKNANNFANIDHLSGKGAVRFTKILNDSVQLLEKASPNTQP